MDKTETEFRRTRNLRLKVRLLLLVPWPMLFVGYWSLCHVKGPASDGFGMGTYASGILSLAYGIILCALNRAIVYSRQIPKQSSADRAVYGLGLFLLVAGILGIVPMLFFFFVGFPFSLAGLIIAGFALIRWKSPQDKSKATELAAGGHD